ncbi:MAG TPA: chloride channel protein [Chitinophagaceae bacterium]|nr:chloride channel protein [Chitinophagaceae bacterium]
MLKLFRNLRIALKNKFDKINNERLKANLLQAIPFWIASLVTGLIAVLYTRLFALAESGRVYVVAHNHLLLYLITPACFLIAWLLVRQFANYARGSGIPQVIAAVELSTPRYYSRVQKLLSLRIIFVKIISSLLMVLGGGVVGREGPTIQVAGSVFKKVNDWLPSWWPKISKRNMIMAGAAAGLAAAFNTPLGGIVFAVEELTRTHINFFKTALFSAIIIAGLTAQSLLGPYLYLGYPDVNHLSPWIFVSVMVVAVLAGLGGSVMSRILLWLFSWKAGFTKVSQTLLYVVGCALVLVTLSYLVSDRSLGSGKEIMTHALFTHDKYLPWYMPLLRIGGSILSFGTGAAGGIFAPALAAGSTVGSVFAGWFQMSEADTNLLILAGMVGLLTGVTRTPFTSAILVLEMTDRHSVIFHLMLAGMVAGMAAYLVDRHSFYDRLKVQYLQELLREEETPSGTVAAVG